MSLKDCKDIADTQQVASLICNAVKNAAPELSSLKSYIAKLAQ
jgi:hypothetical protein